MHDSYVVVIMPLYRVVTACPVWGAGADVESGRAFGDGVAATAKGKAPTPPC